MGEVVGLAVAAATVGDLDVEQVQLVVARGDLPVAVDQQRAGAGLAALLSDGRQRQGAGDDPQAQLACRRL
ncbi:hypothetical protein D3C78_1652980 [compost metagenome]